MLGFSPTIYSFTNKKRDYKRRVIWRISLQRKQDIHNYIVNIGFKNKKRIKQALSKRKYLKMYGLAQIRTGDLYHVRVAYSTNKKS